MSLHHLALEASDQARLQAVFLTSGFVRHVRDRHAVVDHLDISVTSRQADAQCGRSTVQPLVVAVPKIASQHISRAALAEAPLLGQARTDEERFTRVNSTRQGELMFA